MASKWQECWADGLVVSCPECGATTGRSCSGSSRMHAKRLAKATKSDPAARWLAAKERSLA